MRIVKAVAEAEGLFRFLEVLPPEMRGFVDAALDATGTATIRKRRLPADHVLLLVIGLSFYRSATLETVCDHLQIALPNKSGAPIAKSSIPAARDRLGEEPVQWLFERTASKWGHESANRDRWNGRSVYALDGTTLSVPDSTSNREKFGGQGSFPSVRLVTLISARSHTVCAARFAGYDEASEQKLAAELWDEIPDESVTLIDRGFGADVHWTIESGGTNRDWVTRARKNAAWKVIKKLGPKDEIVEIEISAHTRRTHETKSIPKTTTARAIRYRIGDSKESVLLTSLIDPKYSAAELVALYHERWEVELAFDEMKNKVQETNEPLRSKTASGVRQEIWGLLLAFNVVRIHMERVADRLGVPPRRISFNAAFDAFHFNTMLHIWGSPGKAQFHLDRFDAIAKRLLLPERRVGRQYPREVKAYRSRYKVRRRKCLGGRRSLRRARSGSARK
jgi:hypothetical protein